MTILVTGGAGFIGANFIRNWFMHYDEQIINLDKLTYAGNLKSLEGLEDNKNLKTIKGDILDKKLISDILDQYNPRAIIHFAAETHVDKSIEGPSAFIQTNLNGTFNLLDATYRWFRNISTDNQKEFRFIHISTDEVYGSLSLTDLPFTENSPFQPNNPYAASKAASDHIVRSYYHTYGLPIIITHCSNNYGPYQFPEKLIPLVITNAIKEKKLPIYGDGQQIRDWLHVNDHCEAIRFTLERGKLGETYNIGGNCEKTNLEVVEKICEVLDKIHPKLNGESYKSQISFIEDRMGHDRRYALNTEKIETQLGWHPKIKFPIGLKKTIEWFLHKDKINVSDD